MIIFIEFLFFSCLGPEYTETGCNNNYNIHAYHLGFFSAAAIFRTPQSSSKPTTSGSSNKPSAKAAKPQTTPLSQLGRELDR